ncbi:uncharacterized protein V6R79_008301 [Siganus canaliculatus]
MPLGVNCNGRLFPVINGFGRSHTGGKAQPHRSRPAPSSFTAPLCAGQRRPWGVLTPPREALSPGLCGRVRLAFACFRWFRYWRVKPWGVQGGVRTRCEECDARTGRRRSTGCFSERRTDHRRRS